MSSFSWRTNDSDKYYEYLMAKVRVDRLTRDFYRESRWRNWKFRMFCNRRSSEDRLLNRIAETYGDTCKIYYGNWSRNDQMPGCHPSPNKGIRTLLAKRFEIVEVDEFRTSVVCNTCTNRLERYRNRRGRLSHSRLCCTTCRPSLGKERKKRFVDRDINAATNILWAGMSHERPICLRSLGRCQGEIE